MAETLHLLMVTGVFMGWAEAIKTQLGFRTAQAGHRPFKCQARATCLVNQAGLSITYLGFLIICLDKLVTKLYALLIQGQPWAFHQLLQDLPIY